MKIDWAKFQSTHPVRGATARLVPFIRWERAISIHAPRAGCDWRGFLSCSKYSTYFNPRTPCGVRLLSYAALKLALIFQSTHPVRGATRWSAGKTRCAANFNPRTPCGVRLGCWLRQRRAGHFNPRTPCGVRPLQSASWKAPQSHFNPRTPCGVRRHQCYRVSAVQCISIHAPRAGCDGKHVQLGLLLFLQLYQIRCMFAYIILVLPRYFNRKRGFQPFFSGAKRPENPCLLPLRTVSKKARRHAPARERSYRRPCAHSPPIAPRCESMPIGDGRTQSAECR